VLLATSGCQDTRFLLDSRSDQHLSEQDYKIKIIAQEQSIAHTIRNVMERTLQAHSVRNDIHVKVTLEVHESPVAFTEKEVAKEQVRLAAKVEIYDDSYTRQLAEKRVDTFVTYDVCDTLPYADLASKRQAVAAAANDLGHSIAMIVVSALKSRS
jgi:hypothetical protein